MAHDFVYTVNIFAPGVYLIIELIRYYGLQELLIVKLWKKIKSYATKEIKNTKEVKYRCSKCKTKAGYAAGIGEFCPNPKCENNDWGLEEITSSQNVQEASKNG